jgi:putative membrane protein
MDSSLQQDPRVYLAAERTFLAWLRTGLGLIGVGFAVSRFGLFMRQLSATASNVPYHSTGVSTWSGVVLVALGVLVNVSAVIRHVQIVRELSTGTWVPGRISRDAVALALIVAAMGVGMAVFLIWVR